VKILGREPAFWTTLLAVLVEMLVAWGLKLTEAQQAGINAVATLAMGLVVAVFVARDKVIPVAAGLVVAIGQLALAFGAHLSAHEIATAGAFITIVLAGFLHGKVTAPIDANGQPVPVVTVSGPA
jgi:nicotinamide riboside transporter PnuC